MPEKIALKLEVISGRRPRKPAQVLRGKRSVTDPAEGR